MHACSGPVSASRWTGASIGASAEPEEAFIAHFLRRYADLTECMGAISLEELIMAVRRQSQGFSRGTSAFRGVTHHPSGARCACAAQRLAALGSSLHGRLCQSYDLSMCMAC